MLILQLHTALTHSLATLSTLYTTHRSSPCTPHAPTRQPHAHTLCPRGSVTEQERSKGASSKLVFVMVIVAVAASWGTGKAQGAHV